MKILVTGALGFIGSNLTERLVGEGHELYALDNLHTGNEHNLSSVLGKVKFLKGNSGELENFGVKFDAIFHQGIYSSTPMYKENPHLLPKALDDWVSILEYVRKNPCKLVYASTSSIYNGHAPPHREDMPIYITDFYSEVRMSMERLAKLYFDLYGIKSVGLRYFSVYGPHEESKGQYANLISQFLWDLKAGKQPLIYGDGSQTRDFTYVSDIVDANLLALSYDKPDVFNVGTGKAITINQMFDLLAKKMGSSLKPTYKINPIANYVQHTLADTSKVEKLLGFRAKISLDAGIEKLISYYSKPN